jgi:hypothetical protein
MLKAIGHRLQLLNVYLAAIVVTHGVRGDALEVNRVIIILWLNIIGLFRNQVIGMQPTPPSPLFNPPRPFFFGAL